jgi:crotonobetainyl-CoA:carnitine CoA-transferase CaiB-like acyl-CoA transferase
MSDSQVTIKTSPGLGEHNDEVYRDLLKLSDEKYSSLKEKGVI